MLRHCFATDMYHATVPLDAIGTMLGHDHNAETAVYKHVSGELLKNALEQINKKGGESWA